MSDARAKGITFIEHTDAKGLHRYSVDYMPEKVAAMITFNFAPREEPKELNYDGHCNLMHLEID
jgi:hypothetical protein